MKRFSRFTALIVCLIALFSAGCVQAQSPAPAVEYPRHVFIVSFDGGKPEVMLQSNMPTFRKMIEEGASTMRAQTIIPSITLPSHTSMLTGVVMEKHKITWNDYRPASGVVTVPTVFQLAKRHGWKTALFAGKEKFKHLNIPGTLDKFAVPGYSAKSVAPAAAAYIVAEKPNLCFIHFADSDGAGHDFGWGSPEQKKAFEVEDNALKTVLDAIQKAGIASRSVVILTADHGGHDKTHGTASPEDREIPWVAWGQGVRPGWKLQTPVSTCDTAATALWLLRIPVPRDWDGIPVASAFRTNQ